MKITGLECLHANAGFRNFDFLKISTDEGLVGWSEYNESFGGMGVTEVINNLATMMNAHFCAVVPNFRIMEIDCDFVPWHDDFFTVTPEIENGHLLLPTGPGWGTEINEEAVRDHPPTSG